MPAHLIYVPTKKIIGRGDVKAFVLTPLKEHLDKFLRNGPFESNYERECAIGTSIRNVAKYAIFSHRWLNEGEPSFQDMLQERTPTGPGYDKFTRFCKIANSYGCLFAWSDTCCINKESSTELEEAIRSMFRWYSNAHVCIAYLADSSSPEDFKNDVWFTRGWTLQELLAPKMVRFFGAGWQYLGDRDDIGNGGKFTALISAVTTIPVVDLQRFRPGRDRVHEKMRWAARRKTTRVEDIAYCLLGIFDVSLTVAYGEGKQAWARLMEAIIQSCDEWQVFAAAGNFWGVIPDSPSRYCALSSKSAPILGFENRHLQRRDSGDRFFEITKRGVQLKVFAVEVVWKERGCSHLCLHSQRLPPGSPCPAHAVYLPNTRQYPAGTFLPVDMGGSHLPWTISDIHRYGDFTEWALGILNYKETESSDEGELEGKKDYIFLLLGRVGQQGRVDSRSRTYHDNLWCKVPTAQVFTVHCNKTIRRPLTTVWL
ncbi:HET-domain-containing protein [Paxillus ammoniavirescens]|nr:HET-domain-containing protein [Paxillus ammoniavirescens]